MGQFEICSTPERIAEHYTDYCHDWCYGTAYPSNSSSGRRPRPPPSCRRGNDHSLRRDCALMRGRGVVFTPELLADLRANRDAVHTSHGKQPFAKYLTDALRHRFCLASPGEWPATPKNAEYVAKGSPRAQTAHCISCALLTASHALYMHCVCCRYVLFGAAGGCLPLIVIESLEVEAGTRAILPYRRWIDWCEGVYLVKASANWTQVLQRLRGVDAEEAAAKRAALQRIRHAFHWAPPSEVIEDGQRRRRPSGAELAIAEACETAKRMRRGEQVTADADRMRERLGRCVVG